MKIQTREELLSKLIKKIEKYQKMSKKAWKCLKNRKDYTGTVKKKFPASMIELGPATENSIVPWSVFCEIISRNEFKKKRMRDGKEIYYVEGETTIIHLLNQMFPVPRKKKKRSKH